MLMKRFLFVMTLWTISYFSYIDWQFGNFSEEFQPIALDSPPLSHHRVIKAQHNHLKHHDVYRNLDPQPHLDLHSNLDLHRNLDPQPHLELPRQHLERRNDIVKHDLNSSAKQHTARKRSGIVIGLIASIHARSSGETRLSESCKMIRSEFNNELQQIANVSGDMTCVINVLTDSVNKLREHALQKI